MSDFAFDRVARDYDENFSRTRIGQAMRESVWSSVKNVFFGGDDIVEFGCGTGEDAAFLASLGCSVLATDRSSKMVAITRRKNDRMQHEKNVSVYQFTLEQMYDNRKMFDQATCSEGRFFDGVFSNFGVLNCIADMSRFFQGISQLVKPKGTVLLCVMGPVVPWEIVWYLTQREPAKAFRRLRRNGVNWKGLTIYYPSITAVRRMAAPCFRFRSVKGVGVSVPPSYMEKWLQTHPLMARIIFGAEPIISFLPLTARIADHFLIELERVADA